MSQVLPGRRDSMSGRVFSGFQIKEQLGAGGMGVVYRAVDERLGRNVALKFLSSVDAMHGEARERFLREARSASSLDHPNIGAVHAIEEGEGGELCIVMAFYEGETLAERLSRGRVTVAEALRIGVQVADGLAEAHSKCIIHRDIKPSNILLTRNDVVKVVDFGLATCAACREDAITQPQAVIGTAAYMSPEQARGMAADPRADVWSLGAVLYEMLSGRRAFSGASAYSVLHAVVHKEPDALETGFPELDRAVLKALEKSPADRYASMAEFAAEMRRVVALVDLQSSHPTLQVSFPRERPRVSKRTAGWVAAAAVLLAGAGLAAWYSDFDLGSVAMFASRPVTVAITPFSAEDAATAALARGLAESVSNRIAMLERFQGSLVVVPAAELAVRQATTIGAVQKATAATVAIGGVLTRGEGKSLRLDLEFHDTRSGEPVRSRVEDRNGDAAALEQRAAGQIAAMLDLKAAAQLRSGTPARGPAYEAYLRGLGYLQRWDKAGNLDAATAAFTEAVAGDEKFALAYAGLAEAARTRYRAEQDATSIQHALNYAQQAVRLGPGIVDARVVLGRALQDSSQRELAAAEFQKALELDGRNATALIGMARVLEDLGKATEAESTLRRAVSLSPYSWAGRNNLASFYIRQRRYHDAEAQFRRAIVLTPDNAALHSNLGVVLSRQGRTPDALASFRRSVELGPSYAAYVNIGNIYYRQQQYRQAAAAYEEALQLNGNDFRVWGAKAQAMRLSDGDAQAADSAYRTAIRLGEQALKASPGQPRTASLLAVYYAALKDAPAARKAAEQAVAKGRADREVLIDAAMAYALLGDRPAALRWAEAAVTQGASWDDLRRDPDLAPVAARRGAKG